MSRELVLSVVAFLAVQVVCSGQYKNHLLDERGSGIEACEPAIIINPKDPLNIVVATSPDRIFVTSDGGNKWLKTKIISPFGVFGNPVLIADSKGTIYLIHRSDVSGEGVNNPRSMEVLVCHGSIDGGKTWDVGTPVGYNAGKQVSKPSATIDAKGNIYLVWTQFDKYKSKDDGCKSTILLSSSSNGKKWSKPIQISQQPGDCLDDNNTVSGASVGISDDKRIYVTWSHGKSIFIDRSFDGGSMWLSNDIQAATQVAGWSHKIPGHDQCNDAPVLVVDKSKSDRNGLLYLTWADQKPDQTNTDIWFVRSNNFADYWTSPLKINNDSGKKHQYMPWIAVDKSNSYIYILFYDRRDYDDNQTDVYLAYSRDFGGTFKNVKISETPFIPTDTTYFGNKLNISADKGIITPVWTRMDNGKTSVWTTVIKDEDLPK
jgi:hypothetical protein